MIKRAHFFWFFRYGFLLSVLCLIYGFFIEPRTLVVRHVTIKSAVWQGAPLKIALISDIHIGGRHVSAGRIERLTAKINAESPDIILLAGDYVNGHLPLGEHTDKFNAEVQRGIGYLGALDAPFGTYAVMGNHDAWYDNEALTGWISAANISVLENQHRNIQHNGRAFCLVGLSDYQTGKDDRAAVNRCTDGQNRLVFMHSPDSLKLLPSGIALALAGHTHGGQINIPLIGRRATATKIGPKYAYGLKQYGKFPVFITAGVGTSVLPARFRAPPEIVVITLTSERQ